MPLYEQEYGKVLSGEQEETYEIGGPFKSMAKEIGELTGKTELGTTGELPRWQTEPLNLIEDVMARWLGPIENESDYQAVMDRLKYLRAYRPRLKGEILNRANTAIKLLEERASDYQRSNLQRFISQIAEFVKNPVKEDADLNKAQEYLACLTEMRPQLRGSWAQVVDKYASFLKERISAYRKRTPEVAKTSSPKQKLGAPQEIPEILRPFFIVTDTSLAEHKADSKYCRITTLLAGKEWLLGFEEGDESYATKDPSFAPDWDFDEPVLRVIKTDNILNITTEKYGGYTHACRVNYGTTVLFARVGGAAERHVGETVGLNLVTRQIVPLGPVPVITKEALLKALPWAISIGSLGTTLGYLWRRKK